MAYTKRQFIADAFAELGMANYVFDLEPEELQRALRRLDSLMAEWNGKGIRIGYPIPASPNDSDLDEQTSVPDSANEAIITNLAVRLAPGFGKVVNPATQTAAKSAYNVLLSRAAMPPQMQYAAGLPSGAGHKPIMGDGTTYIDSPVDQLAAGPDSLIDLE